ncbi:MAG: mechanosensitive ion channel family protein [bacterium]|nr:mechanosensitive ion channel family protein [bacterium]
MRRFLAAVALVLLFAAGRPALAQQAPGTTAAATASTTTTIPEEDDVGYDSPRSTMRGFLWAARAGDWKTAATHVDLRDHAAGEGPEIAQQLKTILDRKLWVDLDALSNDPEGDKTDGLPDRRDLVGSIKTRDGSVKVFIERLPGAAGAREWKIARVSVQQLPALWDEFGDGPLARLLPDWFFAWRVFDVQLWQWIALAALLLAATVLAWIVTRPLLALGMWFARRHESKLDAAVGELIKGPLRLALTVGVFWAGIFAVRLALPVHRFFMGLLSALLTLAVTWTVLRLIDGLTRATAIRLAERGQTVATSAIPLTRRIAKTFVVFLALLAIFQNFGFDMTGLLAGLGVGGLAVALAAQKSLENLFGGLSLIVDQPVRVGDFCRFGDRVGTVEDIGLRSTRIRTLDRTVVTVPNADFSGLQLENYALRDRIWFNTTLGLRYETTPDQMRWLLVELKQVLLDHPKVDPNPARVRFIRFGPSTLDVEIFAYVLTSDASEFLAVREEIYLRFMDVVAEAGTGFGFPSQTSYNAIDTALDPARQKQVAAEVAKWKGRPPQPDRRTSDDEPPAE